MSWAIRPIGTLVEHAGGWQALNEAETNTPLLDFRFVRDLVGEFADGSEVIATCREGGGIQAMGILRRVGRFYWATLQPANAPIGLWIAKRGADVEALLRRLVPVLSSPCGMLSITQQDPDGMPRPAVSKHLATLDYIVTPSLTVPGSFAEFLGGRSKNFRHNVSRQRNRLKREGVTARLELLQAPDAMAQAVADYSALECASWKGEINSAVRMDEPQGRFYVKMLASFAAIGEALVYRYFFGDRLVASDLCLLRNGTLFILKTACDETIQGLSTAHLMRIDAFADLFDKHGVRRVEFYGPLKEWHTRLTEEKRQMYHVNYYRWPVLKLLDEFRKARRNGAAAGEGAASADTERQASAGAAA